MPFENLDSSFRDSFSVTRWAGEIPGIESKMMTAKSLADLPDTIFCNNIECLGWYEVPRFDTALLDRNMRNGYLVALKLRKVKVRRNRFWLSLIHISEPTRPY